MSEHAGRLPFALDPLIAEAKRRARQRRVLLLAVVILLGAGGTGLTFGPLNLFRSAHSTPVRFEPGSLSVGTGGGPPPFTGAGVSAMSAASHADAWIVGSVAWHWDGRAWRAVPLPKGDFELWSVAAVTPHDAWAVGARGRGYLAASHGLIEHWNGARWNVVHLPHLERSFLFGVSAAGPRSVWAVGATYGSNRAGRFVAGRTRPLLLHWNGASWRRQALPWGGRPLTLDKVVANGPTSLWVVSTGRQDPPGASSFIEHWNGKRWRSVPAPFGSTDTISGFGATGWNDAWAVGSYAEGGNVAAKYSHSLAAHWNGHSWRLTHVPNRSGDNNAALVDVAAVRPDDAWALGESQHLRLLHDGYSSSAPVALLEHWNGQSWSLLPGAAPPIYDGTPVIAATPDGSAWAMGTCYLNSFIVRWTRGGWMPASHPRDRHWRTGTTARRRHRPVGTCFPSPTAAR